MRNLTFFEIQEVSGGMKWEGNRQSDNVIDCRPKYYCFNAKSGDIEWKETFSRYYYSVVNWF